MTSPNALADGWQDISTALKGRDHPPVLLRLKSPIPREGRPDLDRWAGLTFVGRHPGVTEDGFDIGWGFAAPVGHGGFPDDWIDGWHPLPAADPAPRGASAPEPQGQVDQDAGGSDARAGVFGIAPHIGASTAEPTLFEILYLYYSKHFGPSEAETLAHKYKDEVIRLSTPTAPVVTEEAVEKACAILCAEVNDISKDHARDIVGTIFEAAAPHTRAAPVVPEGWRPIETAPKGTDDGTSDRPRILLFPDSWGRPVFGKWNDDRYSTKPRPYWQIEGQSISLSRVADPTHWMFATAPTPPSQGEQ